MTLLNALILAVTQAITEFLPISSSGHLVLLEYLLQINTDTGRLFETLLHIGSAIAIIIIFRTDLIHMYQAFVQMLPDIFYNMKTCFYNRMHEHDEMEYCQVMNNNYQKFVGMMFFSILSCAATGYLCRDLSERMSNSLLAVGLNFLLTAVLLVVVDRWKYGKKVPNDMKIWQAVLIGLLHGLGVLPGLSTLGITITAFLLMGFRKNFAVRYAFLLSLPMNLGAFLFECKAFASPQMTVALGAVYITAALVTAIVSLLCARVLLKFITKRRFCIFAIYSMIIGIITIVNNYM